MLDFRCECKKIVFQVEGDAIIIKCRHCKRFIQINTRGIVNFEYKLGSNEVLNPKNLAQSKDKR